MVKGWTLASHSWSNTATRLWAGLIGLTETSTGTALPFFQRNIRGPFLHLFLGLLYSASLTTGSRRKRRTEPTIVSPSATRLKERSSSAVLVYYPRDVLHLNTWFLNKSTLTGWTSIRDMPSIYNSGTLASKLTVSTFHFATSSMFVTYNFIFGTFLS